MGRFLGADVSAANGLHNAFLNSHKIGGNGLAFSPNPNDNGKPSRLEDTVIES